jgi:hypothetical protein
MDCRHDLDPSMPRAPRPSPEVGRNRITLDRQAAIGQRGLRLASAADLVSLRAPAPERTGVRHPIRIR